MANQPTRFQLLPEGFHGDRHLHEVVNLLLAESDAFIETGTNVGSTLLEVARRFPNLACFSCEPDREAFSQAQANTQLYPQVCIRHEDSVSFLNGFPAREPAVLKQRALFWLDAHCYGHGWPLPAEIAFVASHFEHAWVLIDDCEVPGRPEFGFHNFPGENCSPATILRAAPAGTSCRIWQPAYRERTSPFHPLTGWSLVAFGRALVLADRLLGQLPAGLIREGPAQPAQEGSPNE